jgi:hypothetical protein
MPLGDGTGPLGLGPRTGRGKGRCGAGARLGGTGRILFRGRKGWLLGIAAPAVAAVVRDLANPSGLLRQFIRGVLPHKKEKAMPPLSRDAEYVIVDGKPDGTGRRLESPAKDTKNE